MTNDQTTNNQQPTTNNQQPTTNNQQPTTNNQQPTTSLMICFVDLLPMTSHLPRVSWIFLATPGQQLCKSIPLQSRFRIATCLSRTERSW
jgi:hypothetical protein